MRRAQVALAASAASLLAVSLVAITTVSADKPKSVGRSAVEIAALGDPSKLIDSLPERVVKTAIYNQIPTDGLALQYSNGGQMAYLSSGPEDSVCMILVNNDNVARACNRPVVGTASATPWLRLGSPVGAELTVVLIPDDFVDSAGDIGSVHGNLLIVPPSSGMRADIRDTDESVLVIEVTEPGK